MPSKIQGFNILDNGVGPFLRFLEIRDNACSHILPLLLNLLFRLQNREVKLGYKSLIRPRCAFSVVVSKLRRPRHKQHKDEESDDERYYPSRNLRKIQAHYASIFA